MFDWKSLPLVTCGECEHWNTEIQQQYADYRDPEDDPPVDITVGRCMLARHEKENSRLIGGGFEGPCIVVDGSDYMAALFTKDTHGCKAGKKGTYVSSQNTAASPPPEDPGAQS